MPYIKNDKVESWRKIVPPEADRFSRKLNAYFLNSERSSSNFGSALLPFGRDKGGFNCYIYFMGCLVRAAGYQVTFLNCEGGYELCGVRSSDPAWLPPHFCNYCSSYQRKFDYDCFERATLVPGHGINIYKTSDERIKRAVSSFIRRVTFGKPSAQIPARLIDDYIMASQSFYNSFYAVLLKTNPDVIFLMNGLTFPECIYRLCAEDLGVRICYFDPGVQKDKIFISDSPTPHFRSDSVYERWVESGSKDLNFAYSYLLGRVSQQPTPEGAKRDLIECGDIPKHPYAIFFAPIFHDLVSMEKKEIDIFDALEMAIKIANKRRFHLYIRAHPDEIKFPSSFTVKDFLAKIKALESPYIHLIPPEDRDNAYFWAMSANVNIVYNGTLGMELPALGLNTINIANSHYSNKGFGKHIQSFDHFEKQLISKWKATPDSKSVECALQYICFFLNEANLDHSGLISGLRKAILNNEEAAKLQVRSIVERIRYFTDGKRNEG